MPQLRSPRIYAERIQPAQPTPESRTPAPLPTRYSFHAEKPEWVTKELEPGEPFHVKGSGQWCVRLESFNRPYVVGTIEQTGENE